MKAVILAGGLGTRLSEETTLKPKPMVEIGGKPILWHIMKIYSQHGINEFIICLGYKGYLIKEFFANYLLHMSDVTINLANGSREIHCHSAEPWKVTLVETGEVTNTGGRLKRVKDYIGSEDFCFTYGDGVSDVNITELIKQHKNNKKLATVTAVQAPAKFGVMTFDGATVKSFKEKPEGEAGWINGGFFVLSPEVINYIDDDKTAWEVGPLQKLVEHNQLSFFKHTGFWQPMDTMRDKYYLEDLWTKNPPWRIW